MSEPFVGEIQLFAFSYAPYQWAQCLGQTLPIQQNTALFSLLGVQYGGNGTTNYQLPNFVNRQADNQGSGPALTPRVMGETFGTASVSLITNEIPNHTHTFTTYTGGANRSGTPVSSSAISQGTARVFLAGKTPTTSLSPMTLQPTGGSIPHSNISPILAMNWSIALYGVFPSFN
jgi:microcystin-dependent protein